MNKVQPPLPDYPVRVFWSDEDAAWVAMPLPEPDTEPTASGQTRLRLPRALHDRVIERARIDGVSLNTFIVAAVAEKVGLAQGLVELRSIRDEIANLIARQHELNGSRAKDD